MRRMVVDGVEQEQATSVCEVAKSDSRGELIRGSLRLTAASDDGLRVMLARAEGVAKDHGLTQREGEVLLELVRCDSYQEITDQLGIARSTLCTHARNVFEKTGASSRHALMLLVAFGIRPARSSRGEDPSEDARARRSR